MDGVPVAVGKVAVAAVKTVPDDVAVDGVMPMSKSVAMSETVAVAVSETMAMTYTMTVMYNFGNYSVPVSVMSVAVTDA